MKKTMAAEKEKLPTTARGSFHEGGAVGEVTACGNMPQILHTSRQATTKHDCHKNWAGPHKV